MNLAKLAMFPNGAIKELEVTMQSKLKTCDAALIATESLEEYKRLRDEVFAVLQPQNRLEEMYASRVVVAEIQVQRNTRAKLACLQDRLAGATETVLATAKNRGFRYELGV